jgi:hypothetical protein
MLLVLLLLGELLDCGIVSDVKRCNCVCFIVKSITWIVEIVLNEIKSGVLTVSHVTLRGVPSFNYRTIRSLRQLPTRLYRINMAPPTLETVEITVRPSGVCIIEFNRPSRGNAFNTQVSRVTPLEHFNERTGKQLYNGLSKVLQSKSLSRLAVGSISRQVYNEECRQLMAGMEFTTRALEGQASRNSFQEF